MTASIFEQFLEHLELKYELPSFYGRKRSPVRFHMEKYFGSKLEKLAEDLYEPENAETDGGTSSRWPSFDRAMEEYLHLSKDAMHKLFEDYSHYHSSYAGDLAIDLHWIILNRKRVIQDLRQMITERLVDDLIDNALDGVLYVFTQMYKDGSKQFVHGGNSYNFHKGLQHAQYLGALGLMSGFYGDGSCCHLLEEGRKMYERLREERVIRGPELSLQ